MWPRVAAHATPDSLKALRGVCRQISLIAWREEPHVKLLVQLFPGMPSIRPLLQLQRSGRTQPSTLTLDSTTDMGQPLEAVTRACYILGHQGCRSVTHLVLQGMEVTASLLEAVQGMPVLTHLELLNAALPDHQYQATRLPQKLQDLSIQVDRYEASQAGYASLITELLALDTITHLTLTAAEDDGMVDEDEEAWADEAMDELITCEARPGLQTPALRVLHMPFMALGHDEAHWLLSLAPQLEDLEVRTVAMYEDDDGDDEPQYQVPWRTLRVREFEVGGMRSLPLLGTEDLDIHMQRMTFEEDEVEEEDEEVDDSVQGGIAHLTSHAEGKRRVRLLGTGDGNSTYGLDYNPRALTFTAVVSLLHGLSKVAVRRLDIQGQALRDEDELIQGLGVLPSVSQLSIVPSTPLDPKLLAQLPLHIERVRLNIPAYTPIEVDSPAFRHFKSMVTHASVVPGRQAHPLQLCIPFAKNQCRMWWAEVERCRKLGHKGVIMEKAWE